LEALSGGTLRFSLRPLDPLYWVAICMLIVLFTYLLAAWIFNARDLVHRAERWGYRLAEFTSPREAVRALERRVAIMMLPASVLLCALALAPLALTAWFGIQYGLATHYGQSLLVVIAVTIALYRDLRARPYEMEAEWRPLTTFETELETEMAQALLDDHDIDSERQANRAIPITGSLAPWEACRPAVPGLVIHRRLGGGAAWLWVPGEDAAEAARVLASYLDAEEAEQR
jgi:hypothetical protein